MTSKTMVRITTMKKMDDFVFVRTTNHKYFTCNKSSVVPTYESSDESSDDEEYTDTSEQSNNEDSKN